MPRAIVRAPGADLAGHETTFVERAEIDAERAAAEHAGFVATLERLGVAVEVLPPLAGHPDAVFVEDTAVVLPEVAIVTRPGAASRRGETASVRAALARHRPIVEMAAPATLDGGDVLRVDDVLLVAMGTRTSHAGLKALAHLVLPHGFRVKAIATRGCLHLKTACSYLGRGLALANREWVDARRLAGLEVVDVDPTEPFAANALVLGDAVVLPAGCPRTAERVAARGRRVELVDLTELARMEAGPTCLALLLEGGTAA